MRVREKLEQELRANNDQLGAVTESLELQKKVFHETNEKLSASNSELERVKSELQVG